MNTNWNKMIEDDNAATKVVPAGWDKLDDIAAAQGVSPDIARIRMAPLVKAKKAEVSQFPEWDKVTKRVVRVTAYRAIGVKAAAPKKAAAKNPPGFDAANVG